MPAGFIGFRALTIAVLVPAAALTLNGAPRPRPVDKAKSLASFRREVCFGTCPDYLVSVLDDGSVAYEGFSFVKVRGLHSAELSPAELADLKRAFVEADFFSLKDTYTRRNVTDRATVTISYSLEGRGKTVVHYLGDGSAPAGLKQLEADLDRILGTVRWVGTAAERAELQRLHPGRQGW